MESFEALLAVNCPEQFFEFAFFNFGSVFLTTVCCCVVQLVSLFGLIIYLYYVQDQVAKGRPNDYVILPSLQPIVWVCAISTALVLVLLVSEKLCIPNFFRLSDDYSLPGKASIAECFEFFAYWFLESIKYLSVGVLFIRKSMSQKSIRESVQIGGLAAFFLACLYSLPFIFARTDSVSTGSWTQPFAGGVDIAIDTMMITFYGWTIRRRSGRQSIRPFAVYNIVWHSLSLTLSITGFTNVTSSLAEFRYFISLLKFFIRYFIFIVALHRTLILDTLYWRGYNRKPILAHSNATVEVKTREWNDQALLHDMLDEHADKLIDFTELKIMKKIGEGASATVYEGRYNNQDVAIKIFTPAELDEDYIRDYQREIIMCEAARKSPCTLIFYGVCVRPPYFCLVFELCVRGDLRHMIEGPTISQAEKFDVGKQCVAAIKFLHDEQLEHRDIKPGSAM